MKKILGTCTLLAICAWLPGVASAECIGRTYHVSGKVVDAKGKPPRSKQETGEIVLSGDHTTADLPVAGSAGPQR